MPQIESELTDGAGEESEHDMDVDDSSGDGAVSEPPASDMEVSQSAAAVLEEHGGKPDTVEEALELITAFGHELGRPPISSEVRDGLPWARRLAMEELDASRWREVLEETDLDVEPDVRYAQNGPVTDAEAQYDLLVGALALGQSPSLNKIRSYGEYHHQTYYQEEHDGWADVLEWAGLPPTGEDIDPDRVAEKINALADDLPDWYGVADEGAK